MKISQMTTDQALDALGEIFPYVNNITTDKDILSFFDKKLNVEGSTNIGVAIEALSRYNGAAGILLSTHRPDVYGILSVLNQKTPEDIAAQSLSNTLSQIHEVLHDEDLIAFFKKPATAGSESNRGD